MNKFLWASSSLVLEISKGILKNEESSKAKIGIHVMSAKEATLLQWSLWHLTLSVRRDGFACVSVCKCGLLGGRVK